MILTWWTATASASEGAAGAAGTEFGVGVAYLGATDAASAQRFGLHLDLRHSSPLAGRFRWNLGLAAGLTTPENTVAVAEWGLGAGATITGAFGDVTDWARGEPGRDDLQVFREMSAFFAYLGLGVSYVIVPAALVVSPVASVGHLASGPTVSWHSAPGAPDVFVEFGGGAAWYGDPVVGGPAVGFGPMIGVGGEVPRHTFAVRFLVMPPGLHTDSEQTSDDLVVQGALVVGL